MCWRITPKAVWTKCVIPKVRRWTERDPPEGTIDIPYEYVSQALFSVLPPPHGKSVCTVPAPQTMLNILCSSAMFL